MNRCLLNTLFFFSLTGCIGLNTEKPICKDSQLADLNGFSGTITTFRNGLPVNGIIARLKKGIYLIHEENDRSLTEGKALAALRFCRFGSKVVAEHQIYNPNSKTLSAKTFWPNLVKVNKQKLEFYLANIDEFTLIEKSIPFFKLKSKNAKHGFIVNNETSEIDKKLISSIYLMEKTPNTIIDLESRTIRSPVF